MDWTPHIECNDALTYSLIIELVLWGDYRLLPLLLHTPKPARGSTAQSRLKKMQAAKLQFEGIPLTHPHNSHTQAHLIYAFLHLPSLMKGLVSSGSATAQTTDPVRRELEDLHFQLYEGDMPVWLFDRESGIGETAHNRQATIRSSSPQPPPQYTGLLYVMILYAMLMYHLASDPLMVH